MPRVFAIAYSAGAAPKAMETSAVDWMSMEGRVLTMAVKFEPVATCLGRVMPVMRAAAIEEMDSRLATTEVENCILAIG